MGNKTDPFDYLGHPVPLFLGESKKEDTYVSKGGPLVGLRSLRPGSTTGSGLPLMLGQDCCELMGRGSVGWDLCVNLP